MKKLIILTFLLLTASSLAFAEENNAENQNASNASYSEQGENCKDGVCKWERGR